MCRICCYPDAGCLGREEGKEGEMDCESDASCLGREEGREGEMDYESGWIFMP